MFEDSELQKESLLHAVGYSPSSFGHEVVNWLPLDVSNNQPQTAETGDLKYFSQSRAGRLTSTPFKSVKSPSVHACASECVKQAQCISFSYNKHVQDCELHDVSESSTVGRNDNQYYETHERLGKAYTTRLLYENLPLRHGTMYYVNTNVVNVLGYQSTISSQGTMVDFTPPEPGPVGEVVSDVTVIDGCNASILQRCVNQVSDLKHRYALLSLSAFQV